MTDGDNVTPIGAARRKARVRPLDRGDHAELAGMLLRDVAPEGQSVFSDGEIHVYRPAAGVWTPEPRAALSRVVQGYAGRPVTSGDKVRPLRLRESDFLGALHFAQDQIADPEFFSGAPAGVAFADGFVTVTASGVEILPHDPGHRARYAYPFEFVADAVPTRTLQFFAEVFAGDEDASDKTRLLLEHAGLSLLGLAPRFQQAIVCHGAGANGKSVWDETVAACMPPGSTCAIPPQDLGNEYRRALLAGKRLNIVSELPEAEILDSEAWKAIVVGNTITGRHIREAPFSFRPAAGHLFSCNALPGTRDQTLGFWRRFVVIGWGNVFREDDPRTDKGLPDKLAAEVPSIVPLLLRSAADALSRGRYTVPASHADALDRWRRGTDQAAQFLAERTEPLPPEADAFDGMTPTELYDAYKVWALDAGHRPLAKNKFGERVKLAGIPQAQCHTSRRYPIRLVHNED